MSRKSSRHGRHVNESNRHREIRYGHGINEDYWTGGPHGSPRFSSSHCYKLQNWEPFPSKVFSRPITFANYHVHRHHKKNAVSQISNFDRLKVTQPRGLVFVWPKRRKFYYQNELSLFLWAVSHTLYWLHTIHLFPNGSGLTLGQPPWNYKSPLPKPPRRDYIIEPDWDSAYT